MPRLPYDYYDLLTTGHAPAFDAEAAYRFLSEHHDPLCDMRLAHWRGDIDDAEFWRVMRQYQGANGGFKGGIDPDYTGEILIVLRNTSREARRIRRGDRIAQLVFQPVLMPLWREGDLDATDRGAGGFGHTGA